MEDKYTQNIQMLLKQAANNSDAAARLWKLCRHEMLKEATVYIEDEKAAQEAVIQAFKNAYKSISDADTVNPAAWLNGYVKQECIRHMLPLRKAHSDSYTNQDEIPASRVKMTEDTAKITDYLLNVLNRLDAAERLVSVLRFRDQLGFNEIADKCGTTTEEIRHILTDAKTRISDAGGNLPLIFALVNRLYPFYKKAAVAEKKPEQVIDRPMSDEEKFNTELRELKEFFNTRTIRTDRLSDADIDDSEDSRNQNDNAFEEHADKQETDAGVNDMASSAKMIMASVMTADKDDTDDEYDPFGSKKKRIIFGIVAFVLVAAIIAAALLLLNPKNKNDNQSPSESKQPMVTEEAEAPETTPEETAVPEETAEPETVSDGSIGKALILVTDLSIRTGPGVAYEQVGTAEADKEYTVLETADADGYTWYRVDENQWIPDLQGQYISYTPSAQE